MTWIGKLPRRPVVPSAGPAPTERAASGAPPEVVGPISPKTWAKFGAVLGSGTPELQAIEQRTVGLPPRAAKQLGRVLDRFYAELGRHLEGLSAPERPGILAAANQTVGGLIDRFRGDDRLGAALEVFSALVTRGHAEPGRGLARIEQAVVTLEQVLDELTLRSGGPTLLFGLRNVIELSLSRNEVLSTDEFAARWRAGAALLLEGTPANGTTQAEVGDVVGRLMEAKRGAPAAEPAEVTLAATLAAVQARHQAGRRAVIEQLAQPVVLRPGLIGAAPTKAVLQALEKVVASHPVPGPQLLNSVEQVAAAVRRAAPKMNAASAPAWYGLAKMFEGLGRHPGTAAILAQYHGVGLVNDRARKVLTEARPDQDPAVTLFRCQLAVAKNERDLAALNGLPPGESAAVTLAMIPHLGSGAFPGLFAEVLRRAKGAPSVQALVDFAHRYIQAYKQSYNLGAPVDGQVAAILADAIDSHRLGKVALEACELLKVLRAIVPKALIPELLVAQRPGEAGLCECTRKNARGVEFLPLLRVMLEALPLNEVPARPELPSLARRAIKVALELSQLDRAPEALAARISADWKVALAEPERLNQAAGSVVNARVAPNLAAFLEAHPSLPAELAVTASLELPQAALQFLVKTIGSERSHARVRQLRDLTFLAIEGKHPELISALADSPADPKVKDAWIARLVAGYRHGEKELGLEQAIAGLLAGAPPAAEVEVPDGSPVSKVIGLPLNAPAQAEAVAELLRLQKEIGGLRSFFPVGKKTWGPENQAFLGPLNEFLRAYAQGQVVEHKYGSPISAQMLETLTPEARALWTQRSVTSLGLGANVQEQSSALAMAKGLALVLPKVDLRTPEWPDLAFDAESLAKLEAQRANLLEALRAHPKGSAEHRGAAQQLSALPGRIALLRLHQALRAPPKGELQLGEALARARGDFEPAARFLRSLGGEAVAEVVTELGAVARRLEHRPESGRYVTDEHSLTGFLTAFGSGCINPLGGLNCGVLVEKLASSRYKMCLAWNNDAIVLRSFLRLVEVDFPGYRGPALWLDPPTNAGRTAATPQETAKLSAGMIEHGLAKAHAMGIPFLTAEVGNVAKDKGLAARRLQGKIIMDRGHTGVHHTQRIQGFNAYGISWPGLTWAHGKTKPAAKEAVIRLSGTAQVVMPPAPRGPG